MTLEKKVTAHLKQNKHAVCTFNIFNLHPVRTGERVGSLCAVTSTGMQEQCS